MSLPEINVVKKDWRSTPIHVAICYPNEYRVGIANLAMQTLYQRLNQEPDVLCERYFADLPPSHFLPLTLESGHTLRDFDVVAFTLQYETDYFRLLQILKQITELPLAQHDTNRPLILIGGPCATANPTPLRSFFDVAVIGELDPVLSPLLEFFRGPKPLPPRLEELNAPGLFNTSSDQPVKRVYCPRLDEIFHPTAQVRPLTSVSSQRLAYGDAFLLAPSRGCPHRCHFCMVSAIQHPFRNQSLKTVLRIVDEGIEKTQTKKIAMIASALTDYPELTNLCWELNQRSLSFSLSSVRADLLTEDMFEALRASGQHTITIAPETGNDELRHLIHKSITNDQINQVVESAIAHGLNRIRLYYIIGLPFETLDDVQSIGAQIKTICGTSKQKPRLGITVTPFIPKAHTPFQWAPHLDITELRSRFRTLEKIIRPIIHSEINGLDPRWARIQAILSLGGQDLAPLLLNASDHGGSLASWRIALNETKLDVSRLLAAKDPDIAPPWSNIKIGIPSSQLKTSYLAISRSQ